MTDQELVYVVPRELLVTPPGWRGVRTAGISELLRTIRQEGRFEPRPEMETDPSFKQIVPYLILRNGDDYFLMRRTRAGGDARLHERYSIGVGGHLNPVDAELEDGLMREWHEEINADFVLDAQLIGLLNDDEAEVGAVHLGVVYVADAADRPVAVREVSKLSGRFASPTEVRAIYGLLETWSALAFDFLEDATDAR